MNTERMFINDKDILEFGAKALRDSISVGGTEITNDYFQGRHRTHYTLMSTTYGLKPLSFTLVYQDTSLRRAMENKSRLEAEMAGTCEIHLPDGFYYRMMLEDIGEANIQGVDGNLVLIECKYKLAGIQHDELVTIEDASNFIAKGTMPRMDCMLSVTVGADADSYILGGATFSNVKQGDVLVVDGIRKRFLKNGSWTTATGWITFPSVISGQNSFTALDTVQAEYYPCYI